MGKIKDLDITNHKFGKWTAIKRIGEVATWLCRCDCGSEKPVECYHLLNGRSKGCGCFPNSLETTIQGKTFNRYTVIGSAPRRTKSSQPRVLCRCSCGNERIVYVSGLISGHSKSCGCLRDRLAKTRATTHGQSRSRIYRLWDSMLRRCNNPQTHNYSNYGARGITVCERWEDFEIFYQDMGEPPKGCSIERIDNSKGYSKDNCKWATVTEQARNRRTNVTLTLQGRTMCLAQWAEEKGMKPNLIGDRYRQGWHPWYIFNVPVGTHLRTWIQQQKEPTE